MKGIHSKSATFMMPREPRKRGKGKHDKKKRGISKQQICIGTAIVEMEISLWVLFVMEELQQIK